MNNKLETIQVPRRLLDVLRFWLERANERSESGDIAELIELRAILAKADDADKVNNRQMGLMQFVEKHAAPVVERQDGSALMKIAAELATRRPLRQLYLVCEHQGRINTDSLHEHLDKCGDLLAGIALDIRRAITSPPAPVAVVLPDRAAFEEWRDRRNASIAEHGGSSSWYVSQAHYATWEACLDKVKELNQ